MAQIDTGWQLRLGILKRAASENILRPLHRHGWIASITQENQHGECLIITAKRGGKEFTLALLYTSATSNAVYKNLEKQVDCIFLTANPTWLNPMQRGCQNRLIQFANFIRH